MIIVKNGNRHVHDARLLNWKIFDARREISRLERCSHIDENSFNSEGIGQQELILQELKNTKAEKLCAKSRLKELLHPAVGV